jgi:transglutaminase-like putative cysteine protease
VTVLAPPPEPQAPEPPPARADAAAGGRLPLLAARGSMLLALLTVGGLRWMSLLDPAEPFRAWEAVGVALLGGAALALAARLAGWSRIALAAAGTLAMVALCLLAGGLADEYLRPDRWGSLAAGLGRGISALPGINVPYQGTDEWTRLVLGTGGTALMAGATALALWPRERRTGFPLAALVLLVALAVVPAVVLAFEGEFVLGALLSLLVLGFLRLEKLRRRDAPAAAGLGLMAACAALVLAPAFDGRQPWWDYETWALSASTTRTTSFTWDHDYSPLTWPRDGRELLRIRARQPAYWKARDLDVFAGGRWMAGPDEAAAFGREEVEPFAMARWQQEIRVTVRNLRTPTFITAGMTSEVGDLPPGTRAFRAGGGVFGATRALTRGDSYRATVYAPRPDEEQLRETGFDYPEWAPNFLNLFVSEDGSLRPDHVVRFPAWGDTEAEPVALSLFSRGPREEEPAASVLGAAGLTRVQRLAERLRAIASTPLELVQQVERHLEDGFAYSETPPAAAQTLDGFLFDARIGFCQQYSGAMALLLRMGGVPARVATGFTSGSLDRDQGEYVVRDLDAHSWVEVWFPGFGWVTRDPTPAAAPPRSQPGDDAPVTAGGPQAPQLSGEQLTDPNRAPAQAEGGGVPWLGIALGLGGAAAAAAAAVLGVRRRRRRPPPAQRPLAEFERALRRARYDAGPGATLAGLERAFAGRPGAAGYVRALREQRYSGRPTAPTGAQRRSLRAALARESGRLRAWWALPPRPPTPPGADDGEEEIIRRTRA